MHGGRKKAHVWIIECRLGVDLTGERADDSISPERSSEKCFLIRARTRPFFRWENSSSSFCEKFFPKITVQCNLFNAFVPLEFHGKSILNILFYSELLNVIKSVLIKDE